MEKIPVNLTSDTETTRIEDTSLPENKQDLETIRSEEIENSKERDDLSTSDAILIGKDNKDSSDNSVNIKVLQQSLDAVADNMDKFKINSTMVTKEPESCEALKSETKTEIMKNNLSSEGSPVAHTNVTLQDLSPMRFHRVHGKCIKMSDDYSTARIETRSVEQFSLAECMLFSSRPITVDEKLFLCLELDPYVQARDFYFSFTDCDPNIMTDLKFPDWHRTVQLSGYAFKDEDCVIIFRFCVKPSGEVWCGVNDTDMELLFEKININVPLWACIIPTHFLNSLKLIDCPNENETEEFKPPSLENYSPPTTHGSTELGKTDQKQDRKRDETKLKPDTKADLDEKTKENEESGSTALGRGNGVTPTNVTALDLPPVRFHKIHGVYIKMSDDYCTARLEIPDLPEIVQQRLLETDNKCLVFSSRPIADGEKVYLRLKIVPSILQSSVQFGLTKCDPNSITDLNSWNYNKWLYLFLESENTKTITLHFCVKQSGKLTCCLKDDILKFDFKNFNISGPLWTVLKLSDNVTNVEFIHSPKRTKSEKYKLLSKEKPSPPTTIELKNLIGNVSNLKLDSTMAQEKSKSCEAFKPLANIEKIKSPLNAKGGGNPVRTIPHESFRFHSVHGKYIKLSPDKTIANCVMPAVEPYFVTHECYVFSSRPININEKVHLKLGAVSKKYLNDFSFGFTDCDPCIIPNIMSRLCQSSPCILGNYLTALPNQFCVKDNHLHFYVTKAGEVHFTVNEEEKGVCCRGVNISSRIWAVIKVTNFVSSVRLQNKTQDSFNSYFSGEVSSALKTSSSTKKDETGTSNKNTKSEGGDEKKNISAVSNILTGMPRTDVTSNTKGQTLFDWGVERSVKTEPEFKKTELTTELTCQEALKLNIQPSTSSTPAKLFQPNSSTDVNYTQKPPDSDATHFAKIVEYQLNRVPEDKRMKCMQKILEVLDYSSK